MKKSLSLLVLLCFTLITVAQKNTSKEEEAVNEKVSLLSFNVLCPFAFDTPRYRLGYTHGITEYIEAGVEIGYGSERSTIVIVSQDIERNSYSLVEILPQVLYILNPKNRVNYYVSLQGLYLNHKEKFIDNNYYDTDLNLDIKYDEADYSRKKIGANILFGAKKPFNNSPFGVDFYGGFGVRSRTNTYSNLVTPRPFENNNEKWFGNYRDDSGTIVGITISLGIKLTFNLNN